MFIGGMSCVNCQNKIEKKLRRTDGDIRPLASQYTWNGENLRMDFISYVWKIRE